MDHISGRRALAPPDDGKGRRLGRRLRTTGQLIESGLAAPADSNLIERVIDQFAVSITPDLAEIIDANDPDDPIARQFVPSPAELETNDLELADPIGDRTYERAKDLTHRYPDRVLLKPTHVCPVYCRFCFRREKVGPGSDHLSEEDLATALAYVRDHSEVWEVILTGGDPLTLSDRRLSVIFQGLHAIEHVKVIRVHTRYPVAEPARITDALARLMKGRAAVYVVVHCNHPRELTEAAQAACGRLIDSGIPMLAQTVLLRGVNDDEATLTMLMRGLVQSRIKPYYLHHTDLARGTGHFRTTIAQGQELMRRLRGRVSGLCQPTYVLDIPGGYGKVPIGPEYLGGSGAAGRYEVEDYRGAHHVYSDLPADHDRPDR